MGIDDAGASGQIVIEARAVALVRSHFELINEGRLKDAREQLFSPPSAPSKPLDIYMETMSKMAPFQVLSVSVKRFDGVGRRQYGDVVVVWVDVAVSCSLGERAASLVVWCRPDTEEGKLASRPSAWVIEQLRGSETTS